MYYISWPCGGGREKLNKKMPVHESGWIEKSRDKVLIKNKNLKALFHKMRTYPKPFFNKRTIWSNLCGKCDRTWHTNTQALGTCLICWLIESSEKSCNGKETKMIHTGFFGHFPYIHIRHTVFHINLPSVPGAQAFWDTCWYMFCKHHLIWDKWPLLASFFWGWRPCLLYFIALATCPSYSLAPGLPSLIPNGFFPQVFFSTICAFVHVCLGTQSYIYCSM